MSFSEEYKTRHPKSPQDILVGEHFAILTPTSYYDSEGYGGDSWNYEIFPTRQEWEEEIKKLTLKQASFVPIHAKRPSVTPSVSVSVTSF